MHVSVNGVRLFFDVEGAKFVPDGPVMREKPVLLMLHGGPGCFPNCTESSVLPSCSAARTIRCTRSKARPTSPPRCHLTSCNSSGLPIAGTRSCLTHLSARLL